MTQNFFQVDAFTSRAFSGNPAAVLLLKKPCAKDRMQAVAAENQLSETAFVWRSDESHAIRWFTPTTEVALCGHATLAAAHVLFSEMDVNQDQLTFTSASGPLTVARHHDGYLLNFPSLAPDPVLPDPLLWSALGLDQHYPCFLNGDLMVVLSHESQIQAMTPDFQRLASLPFRGVIVTAPGVAVDFVSRFFGPAVGINEDPVTGSAHCLLAPYWGKTLGKDVLRARQLSARGGAVTCHLLGNQRVGLWGQAVTVIRGEFLHV
jgi:PhzF family phenazine biosynthesis protein